MSYLSFSRVSSVSCLPPVQWVSLPSPLPVPGCLPATLSISRNGPLGSTTGCLAISVKSETPLFSDIYRGSRLFFHVVIGYCAGFDFLKKNLKFFFWFRVWARYNSGMVFRLSLVCSKFKFMFSAGIQFFGLKTTSHVKPDPKN